MGTSIFIFLSILAIWVFAVVLFRELKLDFFKFIAGSLGLFIIIIIFFREPLEVLLVNGISDVLKIIAGPSQWYEVISDYGIVVMEGRYGGILNMSITYQCSGVIELLVYSCLATFFPFLTTMKKFTAIFWGNVYLFICNIIRILFIIASVKLFGVEVYDFSHMILGRIIFFILTILLYYRVFTKNQLKEQRVGEVR